MQRLDESQSVFLLPGDEVSKPQTLRITTLVILTVIMLIIGLANLYSASLGQPYFSNQLFNLLFVIPGFVIVAFFVPIRLVNAASWWIFGGILLSLAIVLAIGSIAGGSQRWLRMGGLGFQPSEFAKLGTAIITAHFFSSQRIVAAFRIRDLMPILTAIGAAFTLIFVQPDFGTAGVCLLIFLSQLAFIRIDTKSIMYVAMASPLIAVIGWAMLRPYQKLRILNLFNPDLDPQNSGYNSLQSLIAIGSGNGYGKGYMQGTQAHLKFLPERHTDFIFSVLAEEHGFLGCVIVFAIYSLLTFIALDVGRHAKDTFSSLLAIGIAGFLFFEFTINIAMVLGLFPVVGLPLPFLSHGASNLFTICISIGLLIAIERDNLRARN